MHDHHPHPHPHPRPHPHHHQLSTMYFHHQQPTPTTFSHKPSKLTTPPIPATSNTTTTCDNSSKHDSTSPKPKPKPQPQPQPSPLPLYTMNLPNRSNSPSSLKLNQTPVPLSPTTAVSLKSKTTTTNIKKRQHTVKQQQLQTQLKRSTSLQQLTLDKSTNGMNANSNKKNNSKNTTTTNTTTTTNNNNTNNTNKLNMNSMSTDNIMVGASNLKPPMVPNNNQNHQLRLSVSSSALPTTSLNIDKPLNLLSSDQWILQYHDVWSRLTLSSFYKDMEERLLSPSQYARWLVDMTSVSITVLEAATRTNEMLLSEHKELPLLKIAKENAEFLAQYTVLNGFDIHSDFRLSHPARRLVDLLSTCTAPDASPIVAITAVWAYMLGSWQAWALCDRRGRAIPPHFAPVAEHLARGESISALVDSQQVLDKLMNNGFQNDYDKAGKTFEEIVTRACAILDHTLYMADGNHVPLCTCGRKGHLPSQCTFKSHI